MPDARTTVRRYLVEAHATELALERDLQAQIAMTPRGAYRTDLEKHLRETRQHADKVHQRARELGLRRDPLRIGLDLAESVAGQALSLGRAPLVLLRGRGGEEKVLKNAKDAAASEALEIATYTAIERLAESVGDGETAKLARAIRADEERMLKRLQDHIGPLTDDVVAAQLRDDPSYDVSKTGAGETATRAARKTRNAAGTTARRAGRNAKSQARSVPGAARAEGVARGAAGEAPISGYDSLTADELVKKLTGLSQVELGEVEGYERRNDARSTVLDRIASLRGTTPWAGYDEHTATEIRKRLTGADDDTVKRVREYERAHKGRQSVLAATETSTVS
ncbi:MAG: DUF892 family protein [Solirubrobacteraceae bacterium]|nr:DUF892 family protein [Solirubrobacteraceae bacterium]